MPDEPGRAYLIGGAVVAAAGAGWWLGTQGWARAGSIGLAVLVILMVWAAMNDRVSVGELALASLIVWLLRERFWAIVLPVLGAIIVPWVPVDGWRILALAGAGVAGGAAARVIAPRLAPAPITTPEELEGGDLDARPAAAGGRWGRWREERRIRRDWPRACREVGMDTGRRGSTDRRAIPRLLRRGGVRVTPDSLELTVLPRGDWGPADYDKHAAALMRYYGGATYRSDPFTGRRRMGRCVRFVIGMRPLPDRVILPDPAPPGRGWPVGVQAGGGEARVSLGHSKPVGLLVAGDIGSGKTNLILSLIRQARGDDHDVLVVDPKDDGTDGDFRPLLAAGVIDRLEHEPERVAVFLEELAGGVPDRQRELRAGRARPALVVVDEAADVLARGMGWPDPIVDRCESALFRLVRKGRGAGYRPVIGIQRPDVAQLGRHGGALRDQLTARVAFGWMSPEGLRMMFGARATSLDAEVLGTSVGAGRGLCAGLSPWDTTDVRAFQAYLDPSVEALLDRLAGGGSTGEPPAGPVAEPPVALDAAPVAAGPVTVTDQQVLDALGEAVVGLRQADLARTLGVRPNHGGLRRSLTRLQEAGAVTRDAARRYSLTAPHPASRR